MPKTRASGTLTSFSYQELLKYKDNFPGSYLQEIEAIRQDAILCKRTTALTELKGHWMIDVIRKYAIIMPQWDRWVDKVVVRRCAFVSVKEMQQVIQMPDLPIKMLQLLMPKGVILNEFLSYHLPSVGYDLDGDTWSIV